MKKQKNKKDSKNSVAYNNSQKFFPKIHSFPFKSFLNDREFFIVPPSLIVRLKTCLVILKKLFFNPQIKHKV